jgi:hypothetical protein
MRKSVRLEALEPYGTASGSHAREILRPERHLRGIRDGAPRERRTGRRKIPNQANGLSRVGRNQPVRTLTAPTSLAANLRQSGLRRFSLRQSGDGDVAARGSAKNATAIEFPQICHAAERFGPGGWRHFARRKITRQSCFMSATVQPRLAASEARAGEGKGPG